jgi:hypothetical protein
VGATAEGINAAAGPVGPAPVNTALPQLSGTDPLRRWAVLGVSGCS